MADENRLAEQCRQESDTRDSMAALARRRADTMKTVDLRQERVSAFEDTATTQVLPPSFIPSARPVTGAVQQTSVGSSARSAVASSSAAGKKQPSVGITPRIASSAPHYAD
jgi:hypothetical protein